jgi:anti-sigma-K factor RskA
MSPTTTQHPGDAPEPIEALLPWYAAGTLDDAETAAVEKALAADAGLRAQLALIREDQADVIHAAESIAAPSTRMAGKLFAAIDAESTPAALQPPRQLPWLEQLGIWLGALTPRKLAFAALSAAALVALQAGIVAALMAARTPGATYEVASGSGNTTSGAHSVLVAFEPTARLEQITALLGELNASIVEGPRAGGLFRLRFADSGDSTAMASRLARLNNAKGIVRLVAPAN